MTSEYNLILRHKPRAISLGTSPTRTNSQQQARLPPTVKSPNRTLLSLPTALNEEEALSIGALYDRFQQLREDYFQKCSLYKKQLANSEVLAAKINMLDQRYTAAEHKLEILSAAADEICAKIAQIKRNG